METEKLKSGALLGITLALLVSLGVNVLPSDTHFCSDLGITMQCNHLSTTLKTCYPNADTTQGKKYCSNGWEAITRENITLEEAKIESGFKLLGNGKEWLCNGTLVEGQPLKCWTSDESKWVFVNCVAGDEGQ